MNRSEFVTNPVVTEFVNWLKENLPQLPICLRIARSRFVPNGAAADVVGIGNVLGHYMWKSNGMRGGGWSETKARLTELSKQLRAGVGEHDNSATFNACCDILVWGGNRNQSVGAYKFLRDLAQAGELCNYIQETAKTFSLATADEAELSPPVGKMNAMLTKVHALYATDGLPIYDSRVAAAIASLVELWREGTSRTSDALPDTLSFPATIKTRTVFRLFSNAQHHPGMMAYGIAETVDTARRWSSAKVRLGWIMEEVLKGLPDLFSASCSSPSLADRMHAFEASLFITGYDVTCLGCREPAEVDKKEKENLFLLLDRNVKSELVDAKNRTSIPTLSGNGTNIIYSGSLTDGFNVQWGALYFSLEPEFLQDVDSKFEQQPRVALGASMNGDVSSDSFGAWLLDQGWPSRRYASAIAAILCHEGMASKVDGTGRGIYLTFR